MNYKNKLSSTYLNKLILPVLWEVIFLCSCFIFPQSYFIYTNFVFYLGIILYFRIIGDFSFENIIENLQSGKKFWIPVFITTITIILAFLLSAFISSLFPNTSDGMFGIARDSWPKLILFAISTILFPPLAEEIFYRQAFVKFDNKTTIIISSIIGMFLYALEHSVALLGIIETMVIAVPLTLSYIKTKNVYVTITAHFIVNLIGNGISVIFTAINLLK